MTLLNSRGEYMPINAMASSDVNHSVEVKSGGSALDITGASLYLVVKDAQKSNPIVGTYEQTITDAANGLFTLNIPKSVFTGKEDEDLSYELRMVLAGEDVPFAHGPINILETY